MAAAGTPFGRSAAYVAPPALSHASGHGDSDDEVTAFAREVEAKVYPMDPSITGPSQVVAAAAAAAAAAAVAAAAAAAGSLEPPAISVTVPNRAGIRPRDSNASTAAAAAAMLAGRRSSSLLDHAAVGDSIRDVANDKFVEELAARRAKASTDAAARMRKLASAGGSNRAMLDDFDKMDAKKRPTGKFHRSVLPSDTKWYIMDPKSELLKQWDIYVMLLVLYTAVVAPVEVAFLETQVNPLFWVNRVIDVSFVTDMVFNFFTARFDDDVVMWRYTFRAIASSYLKGWFTIDLVSVIPFELLSFVLDVSALGQLRILRVIRLLRLLKLTRILRASRILARWENHISISYSIMSLIRFMFTVAAISHWMACAWRIVVDVEDNHDDNGNAYNWMTSYGVADIGTSEQYVAALYWSVMTATTIGYGDVSPKTMGERIVAIGCMFVGASTFAYVVGAVCSIVMGLDEATSKFHQTMDQLNQFIHEHQLPEGLRSSLREYFRHCRQLVRERHYHDLLVQMSPSLRGRVAMFSHSTWILKVPFFNSPAVSDQERQGFIIKVALAVEPEVFAPNEPIVRPNQLAAQMYILQRGVVAKQGNVYNTGQFFGEDMILKAYHRPYSVRTLTFADVFRLDKESLNGIIDQNEFPATRIAIRRSAIALAFRIKFIGVAKTLHAMGLTQRHKPMKRGPTSFSAGSGRPHSASSAGLEGRSRLSPPMTGVSVDVPAVSSMALPPLVRTMRSPSLQSGCARVASSSVDEYDGMNGEFIHQMNVRNHALIEAMTTQFQALDARITSLTNEVTALKQTSGMSQLSSSRR